MAVSNFGSFAFDNGTGAPGLVFPKGSGKPAVFASGLWLGCIVNGGVRVAVASYSGEYGPGAMLGGSFDDPNRPEYKVYKVVPFSGSPSDTEHVDRSAAELGADPQLDPLDHHSWSEYMAGAAPFGAPTRIHRLPDTSTPAPDDSVDVLGPDVTGSQMLWAVYNDADPGLHLNDEGRTAPLGIEVRQSTFAFNHLGPLGRTVFLKFKLFNRGSNLLEQAYVSLWSDPDLGGFTDDLVGCDPALSVGFCYNADNEDAIYGFSPPALGYDFLRGPIGPAGTPLGMTSFNKFSSEAGGDPDHFSQTYNFMQGLSRFGDPVIDPTTGLVTTYTHSGDPVTGQGWLDINGADRRFLMTSGPFTMAPGDSQEVMAAMVIGQSDNRLTSISDLRCADTYVQQAFERNFVGISPAPGMVCAQPVNCPRTAEFWRQQCMGGGGFTQAQLTQIALCIKGQSTFFDWPEGAELASFCATLSPPGPSDPGKEAKAEFAALLANVCAGRLSLAEANGSRVLLLVATPISCAGLEPNSIGELIEPADLTPQLLDAFYQNTNPMHPTALAGVDVGLRFFDHGADIAWNLFGSSIAPGQGKDFHDVAIRFTGGAPGQKAYRYVRSATVPRMYLLQDFIHVPWTVWNVDDPSHPVQLNAGWLENEVTADSQWNPVTATVDAAGNRELIWPMASTYSEAPDPYYFDPVRDDALNEADLIDFQYVVWPVAVDDGTGNPVPIDDGDAFRFVWGLPPHPSVDGLLIDLEGRPLSDPEVLETYMNILGCLDPINHGVGIGEVCGGATPVLASLVGATAEPGRVELTWYAGGGAVSEATLYRRDAQEDWTVRAQVSVDGSGMIRFEDREVVSGVRYGYRLGLRSGAGEEFAGEVWIDVPTAFHLALTGARPNPATDDLLVSFSLSTREDATLALYDVAGRLVRTRSVGSLGPGSHLVNLAEGSRLAAGIYVVRLTQGARSVSAKAAVVR
ncbi:MAG TPA: T9SS type A sorting domain-containing protein [Candidatus Eisenbacteria bacterium]|nr:T9SS type A sorting domain-containing protein [Candidatus Eisenbacteria bacterium]